MDIYRLKLFINTVKHLKLKQIYYQLFYRFRNRFFKNNYQKELNNEPQPLEWKDLIYCQNSFKKKNVFTFLNIKHQFIEDINWNYSSYGKLWSYNLNYFDFLNQCDILSKDGLGLIKDYIEKDSLLLDGKEPYPTSLRGINWIKFLSKNNISESVINQSLYNHYQRLLHSLEYHLLGNHLLENGFSLLFGAYYFKDEVLYKKAKKLLKAELNEQILKDGAHYELSPMYHQILFFRLLDCINLLKLNPWKQDDLFVFLEKKAEKMLTWLFAITFRNGNIPMVNDSTYNIAPESKELFNYAKFLGIAMKEVTLLDSGYRMFRKSKYELLTDVGDICSMYQPGHTHSDIFNFELYVKEKPVIIDKGTSTYEKNNLRQKERSTFSHNTIKIKDKEQTEVWGGFRVGKRAKIVFLDENDHKVSATHNGYKNLGILHTREFNTEDDKVIIKDSFTNGEGVEKKAFFHFHPKIKAVEIINNSVSLSQRKIRMDFDGNIDNIRLESYEYALGFNKRMQAKKIVVIFKKNLTTTIKI